MVIDVLTETVVIENANEDENEDENENENESANGEMEGDGTSPRASLPRPLR